MSAIRARATEILADNSGTNIWQNNGLGRIDVFNLV